MTQINHGYKITKANGLSGVHTAGIYADMTVDGPEIGTLVVIVHGAKNLPNRKSMASKTHIAQPGLAKKQRRPRRIGEEGRHRNGMLWVRVGSSTLC